MDLGIKGRVAMVAASSKGLGRAIAEALAREGCRLSICSRSLQGLERSQQSIANLGADVLPVACDVSRLEDLQRWYGETVAHYGQVDIVVTNTGGPPAAPFMKLTDELWQQGIDSTLMNIVRLCQLAVPDMQRRRWGRIVHLTSFVAKQPTELLTVSSTLRAGISALTKTMADQLAKDNILVNAVLPGHFMTERQEHLAEIRAKEQNITREEHHRRSEKLIPLGRYGHPEELANVVAFLCSERASYLTGTSIQIDGGLTRSTF